MQIIFVGQEEYQWFAPYLPGSVDNTSNGGLIYGALDETDGTAVGALTAEAKGDWLYLTWICIADDWRRKGVARKLLQTLLADAAETGCFRQVRAHLLGREETAAEMLRAEGFDLYANDAGGYQFPLSALEGGEFWTKEMDCSKVVPLTSVPESVLKKWNIQMARGDVFPAVCPVRAENYDAALSMAYMAGGRLDGLLLAEQHADMLYLAYLYADTQAPRAVAALLLSAAAKARELYSGDTQVRIAAVSPAADALVRKLLPGTECDRNWIAAYTVDRAE